MMGLFRNIIIVMSLSGTVIFTTWFIMHRLFLTGLKAKWWHSLILLCIPFYTLPIPNLKYYFCDIFIYFGLNLTPLFEEIESPFDKTHMVVDIQADSMITLQGRTLTLSMAVMAAISFLCVFCHICLYVYLRILTWKCVKRPLTEAEIGQFNAIKRHLHLNRNVALIKSPGIRTPFTIGTIYPVVAIPLELPPTNQAFQMVLKHELVHIKHWDSLLILIACAILSMHWFNPFCYAFLLALKEANELYCDEEVTSSMTEREKSDYCRLLIELSKKSSLPMNLFTLNFIGSAKKRMERRIQSVMRPRKGKIGAAVLLGSVMLNLGICSTLAYANAEQLHISSNEEYSIEAEEDFITEATDLHMGTIPFDDYFIDDNGNIYPCLGDEASPFILCNHDFVNGTRRVHLKDGKGGCTMKYYHAKRCRKCGETYSYDLYLTETWVTCPH